MKKITSILLVLSLIFCLTACSGEGENTSSGAKTVSEQTENSSAASEEAVNYTLYNDLPSYEKIRYHEVYFSMPNWRYEVSSTGFVISDSNDYVMTVAYDPDNGYDGSLDGINEYMHEIYIKVMRGFYNSNYGDISCNNQETVTLDCGAEALKFEGILPATSGGVTREMPIYGYTFVYDGATISITSVIKATDKADEYKATLNSMIDKVVKTIRTQP